MSDDEIFKEPEEGGRLTKDWKLKSDRYVGVADSHNTHASSTTNSYYLEKEDLIESNRQKDNEIERLYKMIDKQKSDLIEKQRKIIEISKVQNEHVRLLIKIKEIIDECKLRNKRKN